jgi:hypothetical protein
MGALLTGGIPVVRYLAEHGIPAYRFEAGELLHYNYP